eukprot:CAMPEP_0168511960 /NCGR_PEP_ID=MMETSP0405-20121227/2476_1 /TAXON_ID=498012 /ORGANISM="Trichosphaerium sp, Strain Am-I-7 wt" /LENGTH=296 /DNA_ID=CAMNT_0008530297 /DNA_START=174 /DNA_END=1064 /DNA_ORIENTATION=+
MLAIGPCPIYSIVPGVDPLSFSGCAQIANNSTIRGVTGSGGRDCLFIGDGVTIDGPIDLQGGDDYIVFGESNIVKAVSTGAGRDCISAGKYFRSEGIDLGSGDDQLTITDVNTQLDTAGMRGAIEGGAGDDCIVVGSRTAKRSIQESDAIFKSFDQGPSKRSLAVSSSFMADVLGQGGRDCIKLYCSEFNIADGGADNDCIDVQASRFHRMYGRAGNDLMRVEDFDAVIALGLPGGVFGGADNDILQASDSRTTPAAILDGGFSLLGQVNRCCTAPGPILSRRCEQFLDFECVSVP